MYLIILVVLFEFDRCKINLVHSKKSWNFNLVQFFFSVHTGNGYDHEEDPEFEIKEREDQPGEETIELSSESSSSDEEEEEMVNEEEMVKLTSMVRFSIIIFYCFYLAAVLLISQLLARN